MAGQDRWLDAGSAHPWIAAQQRKALWMLQTPMLISKQLPGWDDAHLSGQGYGGRPSDVDGRCRAAHPGTLIGTYCSVTLLPDLRTGFVVLINGQGEHTVMTRAPINPDADFSYGHQDLYFQRTGACPAL